MRFYLRSILRDGAAGGAGEGGGGGGGGAGAGAGAGGGTGAGAGAGGAGGQSTAAWDVRQHVDDAGNFKPGWAKAAGIPETYEQKYTSPHAAIRAMEQAQKLVGSNKIALPGPNATPEERNAFLKAIGRPDKPEDYGIKMPEKIGDQSFPKELWDDSRAADFAKGAFEKGFTKEQVEWAVQYQAKNILGDNAAQQQARQQHFESSKQALEKEWGTEFAGNMQAAERGAAAAGLTADVLKANPQLSNDPNFIRAMAKVGKMIGEQPGKGTRQQGGENQLSREDAAARGRELTAEIAKKTKENRNWAATPEAARLMAEKSRMFQLANPG